MPTCWFWLKTSAFPVWMDWLLCNILISGPKFVVPEGSHPCWPSKHTTCPQGVGLVVLSSSNWSCAPQIYLSSGLATELYHYHWIDRKSLYGTRYTTSSWIDHDGRSETSCLALRAGPPGYRIVTLSQLSPPFDAACVSVSFLGLKNRFSDGLRIIIVLSKTESRSCFPRISLKDCL